MQPKRIIKMIRKPTPPLDEPVEPVEPDEPVDSVETVDSVEPDEPVDSVDSIPELRIDQKPADEGAWKYKPLYKTTLTGAILFWQIEFDGIDSLISHHGHVNGKIQESKAEIEVKSGKTIAGQALINARKKCIDKIKEGYVQSGSNTIPETKGMKGTEYNKKDGTFVNIPYWPNMVSPKIDGIRLLVQRQSDGEIIMKTFLNNRYTHLKDIEKELQDYFDYLPYGAILDGELYNHDMTFNGITSAVKTVKSIHENLKYIEFWIFDIIYDDPEGTPYEKRYQTLIDSFELYKEDLTVSNGKAGPGGPKKFKILPAELVDNHEDIVEKHNQYVNEGYEGIMIKRTSIGIPEGSKEYERSLYIAGKRNHIMKWKYTHDEEALVIRVEDCKGKEKGYGKLVVQDSKNNEFPVRFGDLEMRKEWLENPDSVVGKLLTIKYQELSEYGVPRFPVGKAIRDYE